MTSQDGLALLRQMHERGEITDEQYDSMRRHVLWGTPLPNPQDVPPPRSGGDSIGGYGRRYAPPPGPTGTTEPAGPSHRRHGSRRERREAEEARAQPPPPAYPPPAFEPPAYPPPTEGPLPPVGGVSPPRRRHRRADSAPTAPAPTYQPPGHRHRQPEPAPPDEFTTRRSRRPEPEQTAPPDEFATRRSRRPAEPEQSPDEFVARRSRRPEPEQAAPPDEFTTRRSRRQEPEPEPERRRRRDDEDAGKGKSGKKAKKRPRRRSVLAVLTSVVLALALAAGGVYWFELRRAGLPPVAYARQACGTVRDWQQAIDSSNAKLINQISREQNKTIIRSDVTAYYTTIADRTDQLRLAILALGPADLTGGQEYADSLAAAVGDQASGLRRLSGQAARLDPAAATFPTDLQGILTGADAAVSAVSSALARPDAGITTDLRATLSNEPACAPYVG